MYDFVSGVLPVGPVGVDSWGIGLPWHDPDAMCRLKQGDPCECHKGFIVELADGTQCCTNDIVWYELTYKRPFPLQLKYIWGRSGKNPN